MRWGGWVLSFDGTKERYHILRNTYYPSTLYFPQHSRSQWLYRRQGILFCVFSVDDIISGEKAERYLNYETEYTDDLQKTMLYLGGTESFPQPIGSPWQIKFHKSHLTFTFKQTGDKVIIPKNSTSPLEYIDWAKRQKIIDLK